MSTTPSTAPAATTAAPKKPSLFSFASIGHFWTTVVHDFKVAEAALVKSAPAVLKVVDTATAVAAVADPAISALSTQIDTASHQLLGDAIAVATSTDSSVSANGLNLTLDTNTVNALKQLATDIKSAGVTTVQATPTNVPVTAPHTTAA